MFLASNAVTIPRSMVRVQSFANGHKLPTLHRANTLNHYCFAGSRDLRLLLRLLHQPGMVAVDVAVIVVYSDLGQSTLSRLIYRLHVAVRPTPRSVAASMR